MSASAAVHPTPAEVRRALVRAGRGASLNTGEAAALLQARGAELAELMAISADLRDRGRRRRVLTYSPKVFLPLTRLCRDRCHYCTFAVDPASLRRSGGDPYLSLDEVERLARAGAEQGCAEALITLGDRPEERWPAAREWLAERGYDSTLDYVRAAAIRVLETSGLLPHLNPGVMTWAEQQRLRPVAVSMGLMLESSARRLFTQAGAVHHGSPDKDPAVRLRALADAGRLAIPTTSGVLVGIGETPGELAESLLSLRGLAREYGHLQEVIVQNFRAKPDTAARHRPDAAHDEHLAAVATARVLLGPRAHVQAPPNLSDPEQLRSLIDAGIDDWGGISPVTPDHVNPERPWPAVDGLAEVCASAGFELHARLGAYPEFLAAPERWLDPRLGGHVAALVDGDLLLRANVRPRGREWQEADGYASFAAGDGAGRIDLATAIDGEGRRQPRRSDFDEVFGGVRAGKAARVAAPTRLAADVAAGLRLAADNPAALADPAHEAAAVALAGARGPALEALAAIADELRREAVGDDVTYVVNRNINFTNVCYTGCRFCAFAQREGDPDAFTLPLPEVGRRVDEAVAAGATEICMQGGIHPRLPGTAYFDLVREVAARGVHVHAFSPMEVSNGAAKARMSVRDWLVAAREAGLGSIPGTAAEILDDDIRWVLTKGKLPTADWLSVIGTAHEVGLPSSSTMMYGHVDAPQHWVAHLRTLRRLQERTGGFTEFVALPFVHHNAPLYLAGVARPGPSPEDDVAVIALARVLLHGAIHNIQASWVKVGPQATARLLAAGANDIGGTLMEETISRMAGSGFGSALTPEQLRGIAAMAGRPARQRTTTYGVVEAGPGPDSVPRESDAAHAAQSDG